MNCTICGAPATGECSWPSEKAKLRTYSVVEKGDRLKRAQESSKIADRPAAKVLEIGLVHPNVLKIRLQLSGGRMKTIFVLDKSAVRIMEPAPCGAPVCDAHQQDRGRIVCCAHWDAWSKVA